MLNSTQIPLVGGPADGVCHEINPAGWCSEHNQYIGITDENNSALMHWYAVDAAGIGHYMQTVEKS